MGGMLENYSIEWLGRWWLPHSTFRCVKMSSYLSRHSLICCCVFVSSQAQLDHDEYEVPYHNIMNLLKGDQITSRHVWKWNVHFRFIWEFWTPVMGKMCEGLESISVCPCQVWYVLCGNSTEQFIVATFDDISVPISKSHCCSLTLRKWTVWLRVLIVYVDSTITLCRVRWSSDLEGRGGLGSTFFFFYDRPKKKKITLSTGWWTGLCSVC